METKSLSVAVVDDHTLIRTVVCGFLEEHGFTVLLQAANGRTFLEQLEQCKTLPDVCLIDVHLPFMNGMEIARRIKKQWPDMLILGFSTSDEPATIVKMLRSGASGFILKDNAYEEIKGAIMELYTKGYYFSDMVFKAVLEYLQKGSLHEQATN